MAILKWKNNNNWISLYVDAIKNRLRRDLNLADLTDKAAARTNLELADDNIHTHYHDDRYMPLINKEKEQRILKDQELLNKINNETQQRMNEDQKIWSKINQVADDTSGTLTMQVGASDSVFTGATDVKVIINPTTIGVFDSSNRLVYPNGNMIWVTG